MNIKLKKTSCSDVGNKLAVLFSIFFVLNYVNGTSKPAILTIKSEDGDIVDCVDIYSQPAFDHPLLKNHTIQMHPSFSPALVKRNDTFQTWRNSGSCPEGTIPIQRPHNSSKSYVPNGEFSNCKVEIARVEFHRETYVSAKGDFNVWNLNVEEKEWSLNSVTVYNKHDSFMESGWAVSPILFGDARPRIFVNWLDAAKDHGCFNLRCAGFIQTANEILLGGALEGVSKYNGDQYSHVFHTIKDPIYKVWWTYFDGRSIGYWPMLIFENYGDCSRINVGGSICNLHVDGSHTTTEMGSGVFPKNGFRKSSYVQNILAKNSRGDEMVPYFKKFSASCNRCYDVQFCDSKSRPPIRAKGACIYYGGPGGRKCSKRC